MRVGFSAIVTNYTSEISLINQIMIVMQFKRVFLRKKTRTRASFSVIPTNYTSEESLINQFMIERQFKRVFRLRSVKGRQGVKRPKVLLLNLSGIGCRSTSIKAA